MQKHVIDPFEYGTHIDQAVPKGVLFTTKAGDEVDTMVIGWGFLGTIWAKPTFVAYIRTSRESYRLANATDEFTINVPVDGRLDPKIFKVAGTQSLRHVNKVEELGLDLVDSNKVSVPGIAQVPLTLECKVVYKQKLDLESMSPELRDRFYPADVTDVDTGANAYTHMAFYGEVVDAYILED